MTKQDGALMVTDLIGSGRPTHFADRAHEWFQLNKSTCVCGRCGASSPMLDLRNSQQGCRPQWSPIAWLPPKTQARIKSGGCGR